MPVRLLASCVDVRRQLRNTCRPHIGQSLADVDVPEQTCDVIDVAPTFGERIGIATVELVTGGGEIARTSWEAAVSVAVRRASMTQKSFSTKAASMPRDSAVRSTRASRSAADVRIGEGDSVTLRLDLREAA